MTDTLKTAQWIWYTAEGSLDSERILFKKRVTMAAIPSSLFVDVSADSRYILYVNGSEVSRGPCRGDGFQTFFDRVDIAPFLGRGENIMAAEVIHYADDRYDALRFANGPTALRTSSRGGFLVREVSTSYGFSTDTDYWCSKASYASFVPPTYGCYIGFFEKIDFRCYPNGWQTDPQTQGWTPAFAYYPCDNFSKPYGQAGFWFLAQRPIPFPFMKPAPFAAVMRSSGGVDWEGLIGGQPVSLPANRSFWVELDSGDYVTGYPRLSTEHGRNAQIRLLYSEAYGTFENENCFVKGKRDDCHRKDAVLLVQGDTVISAGTAQEYMPFTYRAYRYLRVEIETGAEPLVLRGLDSLSTGYPLEIIGKFDGPAPMNRMWETSLRTLERCMYETYLDCPYYEQMQYAMDTMLETVFTYQISADDRLARKAIRDFQHAQLPNGLIPANAPAKFTQVISGFGFYWVYMVADHFRYFGDVNFMRGSLASIDLFLRYFETNLDAGTGLVCRLDTWEFVDWVAGWAYGTPVKDTSDLNLIYSMMFVKALRDGAELNEAVGRRDVAREYRMSAARVSEAVRRIALDTADGLYFAVPGQNPKSQHAQVWAVLAGIADGDEARRIMLRCIQDPSLLPCSYCMSFFLFRALEQVGLYAETRSLWSRWESLLKKNVLTWPEADCEERSECHGWSALPLYEYIACILGVRPLVPGYRHILIEPLAPWIPRCHGTAATPHGPVSVNLETEGTILHIKAQTPEGIPVTVRLPGGRSQEYPRGGTIEFSGEFSVEGVGRNKAQEGTRRHSIPYGAAQAR